MKIDHEIHQCNGACMQQKSLFTQLIDIFLCEILILPTTKCKSCQDFQSGVIVKTNPGRIDGTASRCSLS